MSKILGTGYCSKIRTFVKCIMGARLLFAVLKFTVRIERITSHDDFKSKMIETLSGHKNIAITYKGTFPEYIFF